MQTIYLIVALALGGVVTFIDTRPGWDDTAVLVGLILLSCGTLGALAPRRAWLWALAVGLWIPLFNIVVHHNSESILALVIAFIGAYAGAGVHWLMTQGTSHPG